MWRMSTASALIFIAAVAWSFTSAAVVTRRISQRTAIAPGQSFAG